MILLMLQTIFFPPSLVHPLCCPMPNINLFWGPGSVLSWSSWMDHASAQCICQHFKRERDMAGYLLLEGGAEFGGQMAVPDRRALELAGGFESRISIIPTAAAPDNNFLRAGNNGVRWFRSLGATHVESLPVIDTASAN